jgi:biotin carboxyl carrier protein
MGRKVRIKIDDNWHSVEIIDINADPIEMIVDGDSVSVSLGNEHEKDTIQQKVSIDSETLIDEVNNDDLNVPEPSTPVKVAGPIKVFTAPMPGMIISISVSVGDQVVPGDEICILEAMKMQQTLRAEWTGIVNEIHVQPAQQIQGGDNILSLA